MREVDAERDGLGIWPFSPLWALFVILSFSFHFVSHLFSSQMWGVLKEKTAWGGKVSSRCGSPGLHALREALPGVSSQPSSIWKHVHSQPARGVCWVVGEPLPRQCYLLRKWRACPHVPHEAEGFSSFPWEQNGLFMEWLGECHTPLWLRCRARDRLYHSF